ncbi:MAG: hypothetical protein GXO90_01520 [FCB group bacterium]|nr:hypothetical protein [FCB group bacterium]
MSTCDCYKTKAEIDPKVRPFYRQLPEQHVLKTFVEEHAQILGFLHDLKDLVHQIESMSDLETEPQFIHRVEFISRHLLETERHHIREEISVLTRLAEAHESYMTTRIRKEHDILGVKKRQFSNLILNIYTTAFDEFKTEFVRSASDVVEQLSDHIHYEDSVLYPLALETLTGEDWINALSECDRIGYCCFTPGEAHHLREINTLAH